MKHSYSGGKDEKETQLQWRKATVVNIYNNTSYRVNHLPL